MVTRRLAAMLLRVASRRWPARLRADLHREWSAELAFLAGEGRAWAMLRYAGSLAVARPVREPLTLAAAAGALWRAFRLTVLAPLATLALLLVALLVATVLGEVTPQSLVFSIWSLATVGAAVLLARTGRWWSLPGAGTTVLALAATVPAFAVASLIHLLSGNGGKLVRHGPATALFFGGLVVLLHLVDRLAAAGRRVAAWWAGGLGAVVLADAAVALTVLRDGPADDLDAAHAWVWLPVALTDSGFGLVSEWGRLLLLDVVELDPPLFIGFAGLALGVMMARRSGQSENGEEIAALNCAP